MTPKGAGLSESRLTANRVCRVIVELAMPRHGDWPLARFDEFVMRSFCVKTHRPSSVDQLLSMILRLVTCICFYQHKD
jgi:hypothetical protein